MNDTRAAGDGRAARPGARTIHFELDGPLDSDRVRAVRRAAEGVIARYDRGYLRRCIAEDPPPLELLAALAGSGLLGIGLGEKHGSSGGGVTEEVALIESLTLAGLTIPYVQLPAFTRRIVAEFGSAEQRASYLPRTLSGREFSCFALTEANSGTNLFAMRTKAERVPEGWRVSGEKIYISGVDRAAQMLLAARTGTDERGRAEVSLFIVELPATGVAWTPMRTAATLPEHQFIVSLEDVLLPDGALVGAVGAGARMLFTGRARPRQRHRSFYEYIRLRRLAPLNNESILNYIAEQGLGLPRGR